ncbi:hypothetical protein ACS0TY_004291 [Phlomoides rotata]
MKATWKLEPNWEGPYVVTTVLKGGAYVLTNQDCHKTLRPWNISKLREILCVKESNSEGY